MENLLQSEELELPQPLPQETNQQHLRVILTWFCVLRSSLAVQELCQ